MSQKHILLVKDSYRDEVVFKRQILKSNQFFRKEVYKELGAVSEDENFFQIKIEDIEEFFAVWWRSLNTITDVNKVLKIDKSLYKETDSKKINRNLALYFDHQYHQVGFVYDKLYYYMCCNTQEKGRYVFYIECY